MHALRHLGRKILRPYKLLWLILPVGAGNSAILLNLEWIAGIEPKISPLFLGKFPIKHYLCPLQLVNLKTKIVWHYKLQTAISKRFWLKASR